MNMATVHVALPECLSSLWPLGFPEPAAVPITLLVMLSEFSSTCVDPHMLS